MWWYVKGRVTFKENFYSLHDFPNISKFETIEPKFFNEEYQEYVSLKTSNLAQSSTNPS